MQTEQEQKIPRGMTSSIVHMDDSPFQPAGGEGTSVKATEEEPDFLEGKVACNITDGTCESCQ